MKLFILLSLFTSTVVLAHNTNVTHPLLTLEAVRLIEESDKNLKSYQSQKGVRSCRKGSGLAIKQNAERGQVLQSSNSASSLLSWHGP